MKAGQALAAIWSDAGLPAEALDHLTLTGDRPVVPSSFAVTTAAHAVQAAAALAAAEVWQARTARRQQVAVDAEHATLDTCAHFEVDGAASDRWDKLSGLYPCGADVGAPGWIRIHANFAHHRDGALKILGLPPGDATEREAVVAALRGWRAQDYEDAGAEAGVVIAAKRSFADWDAHPQSAAVARQPLVGLAAFGDAPARAWPSMPKDPRPLAGLRVLDLTRILAGPVCGRTLAAFGADVMLVNSPGLPNIDAIADTSRGKLSVHVDLRTAEGRATLEGLVREADVFVQGYRPGAIEALGFGPKRLAELRPGIVSVSLSAYTTEGPWAGRRGFDSLVQTATGFNHAEAEAAGSTKPQALPVQILDYCAGFLLAFGAQAALLKQRSQGGDWQVTISLARVAHWVRSLGRVPGGLATPWPAFEPYEETTDSGFGRLKALKPAARFSETPAGWSRPSMPPGSHPPAWPA